MQEEEHIYICENNEYSLKAKICVGQKKKKNQEVFNCFYYLNISTNTEVDFHVIEEQFQASDDSKTVKFCSYNSVFINMFINSSLKELC